MCIFRLIIFISISFLYSNIEYNQIALVDSSSMIKWDAPNFFDMTDDRFTAWVDNDNLKWIYESIQGYKPYFDNFELDISEQTNLIINILKYAGVIIKDPEVVQLATQEAAKVEQNEKS